MSTLSWSQKQLPKLLYITFLLGLYLPADSAASEPGASVFDLRHETWGEGDAFSLKGYWQFAWQSLQADRSSQSIKWEPMHVPGSWDLLYSKGPDETRAFPAKGYGTYFVRLLVPDHLEAVYLYLPDMASAYELWLWGEKLGGNGVVGINRSSEKPDYLPKVYKLNARDGIIDLYILTSNFHYQWGGLWYAPKITDDSGLFQLRDRPIIRAISGGTILIASAIFCFLLYLSRKQDKKILYFSLFCLAIGIRRLCIDERVLYLTPYFDWQALQAAENISMYLMMPLFLAYFRHAFSSHTPKWLPLFGSTIAIPFCLVVLTTDVEFYTLLNRPFQASLLIFAPLVVYYWYQALKDKAPSAKTFGLSLTVFLLTVINDVLNYNYIIETNNLMHMGALAFVLFQVAALVQRYLKNFKKIEGLSESLAEQNKALLEMDKFKDDFLASTSHELRTPLQGIAGLAKTLKQEATKLSPESQNRIRLIQSTAKRLGYLVNDILDVSSMKHGKLELHPTPIFLRPVVENTILSLRPLVKDDLVMMECLISDEANHVLADEQRLQQILFNLIGNAIKFTHQGSILIEAHKQGESVVVWVKDTGRGIREDKLNTVLKPFETLANRSGDTRDSGEIRGSGLGLPITKMLVELHQGELTIDSQEGHGTQVQFSLPWVEGSNEITLQDDTATYESEMRDKNGSSLLVSQDSASESVSQIGSILTQGALIFFVDDEAVNRSLVSGQLSEAGYQVKVFASGERLLEHLKNEQPELILLDWMMPERSGLEVCQEIRKDYDRYNLPVMMLTAKHQIGDIVQALSIGANDYLTKPYHEQELLARVHSQLSVKRLITASQENEKLLIERSLQEAEKHKLDQANQRLTDALNATPESLVLLNEDLDIEFANEQAKALITVSDDVTIDTAIANYIDGPSIEALRSALDENELDSELVLHTPDQGVEAKVYSTERAGNQYILLVLKPFQSDSKSNDRVSSAESLLTSLTQELAENRQRMGYIEETLKQLTGINIPSTDQSDVVAQDPKELVVKTLRLALITWERSTHRTKAELAEQSRCWRVYLDGTSAKTRTLDKYLSVKTLPAKPRWRAVIKTANYVLDHCELNNADRGELSNLINELNQAYS